MCLCKYGCSSQLRTPGGRSDLTLDAHFLLQVVHIFKKIHRCVHSRRSHLRAERQLFTHLKEMEKNRSVCALDP
jgi:hypothetical protein